MDASWEDRGVSLRLELAEAEARGDTDRVRELEEELVDRLLSAGGGKY